jgi:enoyl reductase-like protein
MLSQLEAVGIKVVCVKPGSVDDIEVAAAMLTMTVDWRS